MNYNAWCFFFYFLHHRLTLWYLVYKIKKHSRTHSLLCLLCRPLQPKELAYATSPICDFWNKKKTSDGGSWGQHNSSLRKTNEYSDWLMFGPWEKSLRSLPARENGDTFTYGLVNLIIQESWLLDTPSIPQRGDCIYFPLHPFRSVPNRSSQLFLNLWQILRPSNLSWGKVSATFTPSFHHVSLPSFPASLWVLLRGMTGCNSSLAAEASLGCA